MTSTAAARRATARRRGPASSRRARGATRRPDLGIARGLTIVVSVLCTVGMLMVYSSSTVESINGGGSPFTIIAKQLAFLTVGALAYVAMARFDYRMLRRFAFPSILVGIALLHDRRRALRLVQDDAAVPGWIRCAEGRHCERCTQ